MKRLLMLVPLLLAGCGGASSEIPSEYKNAKLPDKPPELTSGAGPEAPPPATVPK